MTGPTHCFFLTALDPDLGCPVLQARFLVADLVELATLLAVDPGDDPDLLGHYDLDTPTIAAVVARFGVAFDAGGRAVRLGRGHWLDTVPYLVHTHYELFLMLEGRKKFARMGQEYPPHDHYDEHLFDRFVVSGLLHKEIELQPFPKPLTGRNGQIFEGIREVYYTLKGEEWRIPAWKLIYAAGRRSGWNRHYERLEGMLFGYEDWQMDWWISRFRNGKAAGSQSITEE